MICKYCEIGDYFNTCICTLNNNICPFMRRCNVEKRWLPLNTMEQCHARMEVNKVDIVENGKYNVLFEKNHQLYVEVDNAIIKVDNPFDVTPTKVNLNEVDGVQYVSGYEPKPKAVTKKGTNKKNKKKEDK